MSSDGSGDVFDELAERWRAVLVGSDVPDNDDYRRAVDAQDALAREDLAALRAEDGTTASPWPDLPVDADTGSSANVTAAAVRIRAIATGYATAASALHGDPRAASGAAAAIRMLCAAAFRPGPPGDPAGAEFGNWWDWEIGTPKALGDACVLLGGALTEDARGPVLDAIDYFVPDPRRMLKNTLVSTGANRVDLCRAVAVRGALGRDGDRIALASSGLTGVLDEVVIGDGFHPDGSFLMHTWVAYPGTYGEVLLLGMAELMRLLAGTDWDVAARERKLTTDSVDRSFAPFLPDGLMDDTVRGRALSRTAERDADDGFAVACDVVSLAGALDAADPATAARFRSMAKGWLVRNTFRPLAERPTDRIATVLPVLADASIPAAPDPAGVWAFPEMDRVVARRPGWQATLALNSDRIARFEYMNGENAHGWHTGDGMLQLRLAGDPLHWTDEYWPTVDARRLPGTTVDTAPLPAGAGGQNEQDGLSGTRWSGVCAGPAAGSDAPVALAGLELTGWASTLTARKSWLFLGDAVLAAGSGITATGKRRIETVVDNRNLRAPGAREGVLTVDGRTQPPALGETAAHPGARWAHLDGTGGYVFLPAALGGGPPPALLTRREDRTGSWHDLNTGGPSTPVTRRYLTLWHDHGTDPSGAHYAHLLLPAATAAETRRRSAAPGVEVAALTADVHAFRTADGLTAVNVFAPGGAAAAGVRADGPCSVLVDRRGPGPDAVVSVSDPSRTSAVVRIEVRAPGAHRVVSSDPGITVESAADGRVRLAAELGGTRGATLSVRLGTGTPAPERAVRMLAPVADASVRSGAHAGENDGAGAALSVRDAGAAAPDDSARSLLAFDVGAGRGREPLRRARLWVFGAIPHERADKEHNQSVQEVAVAAASADWTESTVTWNNAPAPGSAAGTGAATVHPDWIPVDVTAAVQAAAASSGRVAFALSGTASPGLEVRLSSREAGDGYAPRLELVT